MHAAFRAVVAKDRRRPGVRNGSAGEPVALDIRRVTCNIGPWLNTMRLLFVSAWPPTERDCGAKGCDRCRSGYPTYEPPFAAEAHRQSALAAASPHAAEDQAFVDAISWFGDEAYDQDEE